MEHYVTVSTSLSLMLLHHATCGTSGNDVMTQQFGMPQGAAFLRGCCGNGMDTYNKTGLELPASLEAQAKHSHTLGNALLRKS